jgi:hypothetical protein
MALLLLVEQIRLSTVHHHLHTRHIQYAVMHKRIQPRHLIQQKQLVHMYRITRHYQLTRFDPQAHQILENVLLSLLDRYHAVYARKGET